MNKSSIVVLGSICTFFLAGCSLDDSTSLGVEIIQDINPSLLDVAQNFRPFNLDTSIVGRSYSIPENVQDTVFGVHSSIVMPIGGSNGEVATGYFEFRTNFNSTINFKPFDTINSVSIVFDTLFSEKPDCNYAQSIRLIKVADPTYKHNRNELNTSTLLKTVDQKNHPVKQNSFESDFIDSAFYKEIFQAFTSGTDSSGKKIESLFKPDTFRFVLASETNNSNYAYFRSTPHIKIHTKYGAVIIDTTNTIDTALVDTLYSDTTLFQTFLKTDTSYLASFHNDILYSDTTIDSVVFIDSICTRIVTADTLNVIDSVRHTTSDSLHITIKLTKSIAPAGDGDSVILTTKIDTMTIHNITQTLSVRSVKFTSHTYTLPTSYSNYTVYEVGDTLNARANRPYSSFGPQRTAAFTITLDSLWKKLNEGPDPSGNRFNQILSAGIKITGLIDFNSLATTSTLTSKDSSIAVRWLITDNPYHNGIKLSSKYRYWSNSDTLKSNSEAVLQVEKYLQEMMTGYGSSATNIKGPPTVYLYLEQLSSGIYSKQISWSKPALATVLTNLK